MEVLIIMSDVTFGVKVPEELKAQLEQLQKDSGLRTGKDFIQQLVNNYVVEKTKENIPQVAEDLRELQTLTQRINNIYLNLGYRIDNITKAQEEEQKQLLSKRDSIISDLQSKIEILATDKNTITEAYNNTVNLNSDYLQRVNQLTDNNNNIKALITEYKTKNDDLLSIVSEYKQYKDQVEQYKELLSQAQAQNIDLSNTINNLNATVKAQDKELEQLNNKQIQDLEQIKKESELNIKLAVAEVKEELNNKLNQEQQKHNAEIQDYQNKYKSLLEQMEKAKNTISKKNTDNRNDKQQKFI